MSDYIIRFTDVTPNASAAPVYVYTWNGTAYTFGNDAAQAHIFSGGSRDGAACFTAVSNDGPGTNPEQIPPVE